MEREVLRKKNREEYNQFLLKLNELYDPNEYGSIQNLARTKIMDFMAYCDSKDVYYFSELPISEIVNKLILEIVEDSLVFNDEENAIMKKLKDNRGFGFNILDH